jgi:hypothetical protein
VGRLASLLPTIWWRHSRSGKKTDAKPGNGSAAARLNRAIFIRRRDERGGWFFQEVADAILGFEEGLDFLAQGGVVAAGAPEKRVALLDWKLEGFSEENDVPIIIRVHEFVGSGGDKTPLVE